MAHTLSTQPTNSVRNLTLAILVVWFLLAVAGSLLGVFDSEPRPPLPLGLAAVIPVTLFAFCYLTSARFQEFVMSLDLRILTVAQTWRVGGIVFLILYQHGALPGVFAIPAGWGDIAIGITAPIGSRSHPESGCILNKLPRNPRYFSVNSWMIVNISYDRYLSSRTVVDFGSCEVFSMVFV